MILPSMNTSKQVDKATVYFNGGDGWEEDLHEHARSIRLKVKDGDKYAEIKLHGCHEDDFNHDLESCPVVATKGDEVVYDGDVVEIETNGTRTVLKCDPPKEGPRFSPTVLGGP